MKRLTTAAWIMMLLMSVRHVWADSPSPPNDVWTGKGQVGFVGTEGNTDNKAANASIDMTLVDNLWKHILHLGGLYGENDGVTSAERWDALWQSNYNITTNLFTYGALRYARDMFNGFEYQGSGSVGMGYQIFNTDSTKLSGQLGIGYRNSRPEELIKNSEGEVISRIPETATNNAILDAGLDYSQALSKSTTLSNKFTMESGSSDTLFTNALALTVKMSDRLALSLGYGLQDNTKPPANLKNLDSTETINLVYSF